MKKLFTIPGNGMLVILIITCFQKITAQTDPSPQSLPYTQDFSTLAWTSTTYPAGWQGWELNTSGSQTTYPTTAPTGNLSLQASASASTTTAGVLNYNQKLGILASSTSNPSLVLAVSTQSHSDLRITFDVMTIRAPSGGQKRVNNVEVQYRVGTSGSFTSLSGTVYSNQTTSQVSGTNPLNVVTVSLDLPSGCNNKQNVQLRWVQKDSTGSNADRPSFAVDNISICEKATVTAGGPTTFCSGNSVTLTASSGTSYLWSGGQTTQAITVSTTGNYSVTVSQGACSNKSASVSVTANALPNVTVNSATVCAGNPATLTASGATSYSWNTGATTASISATPSSTTSYTVTGTTNGCSKSATSTITVTQLPNVVVNSATVCAGQSATLTASGATSYSWNTGATTQSLSAAPSSTTNYTVTGTMSGCSKSATSTITVNQLPTVTVNSGTVCQGNSVSLSASGAATYSWNTGASSSSLTVSPSSTTNYTVTGTAINGCSSSAVATVTVNSLPTMSVNSETVCIGNTAILTAAGAPGCLWSTGETTESISVSPGSTTSYTVTGTNNKGCTNSAVGTVHVNQLPNVSVTSATVCNQQSATITASGAVSYVWSGGETTNSITISPASTTNYSATGTDANGCTSAAVGTVSVNQLPTITVSSATVCEGNSATLTAGGATAYLWSNGATTTAIAASPSATTSYTVTGTDENGCSNSAIGSVNVNALPTAGIISNPSPATIPACSTIALSGTGATTYEWNGGVTDGVAFTPAASSNFIVKCTDANGCSNTAVVSVTVTAASTVPLSFSNVCCGTVLNSMTQLLQLVPVEGATNYQYCLTDLKLGTVYVYNRGFGNTDFRFYWIAGIPYNTTFDVKVRAFVNGSWGAWGSICNLTTPDGSYPTAPEIISPSCGSTLTSLTDIITVGSYPGATNYQYQLTNIGNGTIYIYNRGNGSTDFHMNWITGIPYNATFEIKVRAYLNGSWSEWGNLCNLTTPSGSYPTPPEIISPSCGGTLNSIYELINISAYTGATNYQYQLTNLSTGAITTYNKGNGSTDFRMAWVPGILYSTTYSIKVRGYYNGGWKAWGNACQLTTPANNARLAAEFNETAETGNNEMQVNVYPNPAENDFSIESSDDATVIIYNLTGQVFHTGKINIGVNPIAINAYQSGVYIVKVISERGTKQIRLIKNQ
jgi:hypothetical protein